jgi:Domain of unknown function (DUF1707)
MVAAARGRGHLRVSHADREQAIDVLKAAFALGRLAKEEFEARVGRAFTSRTYAELAAVVADIPVVAEIPAGPPAAPSRRPARALRRPSINQAVTGGACMVIAAHIGMLAALLIGSGTIVILVAVLIVVGAAVAIAAMIVAS